MKYDLAYKCRICGERVSMGQAETTRDNMLNEVNKTVQMDKYMNGFTGSEKMMVIHNCKDGSIGIADFIGARRIG
jgi:hypothetical protein